MGWGQGSVRKGLLHMKSWVSFPEPRAHKVKLDFIAQGSNPSTEEMETLGLLDSQSSLTGKHRAKKRRYASKINKKSDGKHMRNTSWGCLPGKGTFQKLGWFCPHPNPQDWSFHHSTAVGWKLRDTWRNCGEESLPDPVGATRIKREKVNRPTKHDGRNGLENKCNRFEKFKWLSHTIEMKDHNGQEAFAKCPWDPELPQARESRNVYRAGLSWLKWYHSEEGNLQR